jgi:hypothetical protein
MTLTRTRLVLLALLAAATAAAFSFGFDGLPLAVAVLLAGAAILFTPRRVPVRDRPFEGFDDGKDLTKFGWAHPLATSMMWGAAGFAWLNGTSQADAAAAADGLGGADLGGGFDAGGGGSE